MTIDSELSSLTKLPHVSRHLAGETMLLAIDSPQELPIRLNHSGSEFWDRLDGLAADDRSEFSADEELLIDALTDHGLLELSAKPLHETLILSESNKAVQRSPTAVAQLKEGELDLWELLRTFDPDASDGQTSMTLGEAVNFENGVDDIDALVELVERQGAIGQLAHAIDTGWITTTTEVRSTVQERWAANQLHCLRVEQLLVQAARMLDDANIEFRVLKGVAVAHLDYPDPNYREFGDADILVREDRYTDATNILTSDPSSLQEMLNPDHPFSDKSCTLITRSRLMLDVHQRLAIGGLGACELHDLFENPVKVTIGGHSMYAPPETARLVHASVHHFTSRRLRRGTLRDFHELRHADPDEVARLSSAMRYTGIVKHSLQDVGGSDGIVEQLRPTRLERALSHRSSTVEYNHNILWREATGLFLTRGLRNRAAYLRQRLFPSARFRAQNGISWKTYAEVATKPIASWRRRRA